MSINILKSVQTSFELVLRYFHWKKMPSAVHPGGSKLGKNSKNWKNFHLFKMAEKTFPKAIKHVFNMLRGIFLAKIFAQCTLGGRNSQKIQKVEKLRILQNSPKTFPKTLLEHVLLDYFDGKKLCPVNPGDSKKSTRSEKTSKFQNPEKRYQKCPNLLEVVFSNFSCPVQPGDRNLWNLEEKIEKNWFLKSVQKYSWKSPHKFWTCFQAIFSEKSAQCTL